MKGRQIDEGLDGPSMASHSAPKRGTEEAGMIAQFRSDNQMDELHSRSARKTRREPARRTRYWGGGGAIGTAQRSEETSSKNFTGSLKGKAQGRNLLPAARRLDAART